MIAYFLGGCAIYGIVLFVLVMLRPKSALHTKSLQTADAGKDHHRRGVSDPDSALHLPMGLAPGWNGEDQARRISMELVAEAILNGHINIDNGDVRSAAFYRWTIRMIRRRVWISAWTTAGIRRTITDIIICILALCRYFCCSCRSV